MTLLAPSQYADDQTLAHVRRCRHCSGEMRCKDLTEHRVNGGYTGRTYTFVCLGCARRVTELSTARAVFMSSMVLGGGFLGLMLVGFGVKMLVQTVVQGAGGNDLSAVILVLVVFLGLGAPFLLMTAWVGKMLVGEWLELRRNPLVRLS